MVVRLYLTHATVIYALRAVWGRQRADVSNVLLIPPVLAVAVLVAWLAYRLVEHPAERRLRGMLPPVEPDRTIDPSPADAATAAPRERTDEVTDRPVS